MRIFFLCGLGMSCLGSLLMGSGFTLEKGRFYSELKYQFQTVDKSFDNRGNVITQPEVNLLEDGIEADVGSLFLAYGVMDRLTLTANFQYVQNVLKNRFASPSENEGFSDIFLEAWYLLYKNKVHWVLNAGAKLPQQENRAVTPQITNGENEFGLGIGVGYGEKNFYLEGELAGVFREGFVNNVQIFGIPYEDSLTLELKGGWQGHPKWLLEGRLFVEETTADLEGQGFIAGVYTNSDSAVAQVSALYRLTPEIGFGVFGDQVVEGKNVLLTKSIGFKAYYKFSWK